MADHLAGPHTRIINRCITKAYFPKLWKIARVSPIPKVDNPTTNDELRPISILPVLSKVFERLVGWQMSEFANSASLLHDNISSFRKGHSTTTALLGIRDDIKLAVKRKEITLMVLADFSKAFDTVCFKTTLKKFYKLGFTKNYLKWFISYLSGRTQFVQIDDTKSHLKLSQFGIPQGSILGPMIFNLYVSDLRDNLDLSTSCSQYADDTSLYTHCAVRELESTTYDLNESLTKLGSWSKDSNLDLNPNKTKFTVLSTQKMSSYHKLADRALNLTVGDNSLERVESTKFPGANINGNLKWDDHIKHLAASCYATLATLKIIKNFTNFKSRKHLAEPLVLSRLDFSDIVFYPHSENLLKKLQRIQFSAVSFVTGHYVNSVNTLFKIGRLPLSECRDWHLLKAAHKALYDEHWPKNLRLETVQHGRCLRSSETINLKIPLESGTFQDCTAKCVNSLSAAVKSCPDFNAFSKEIHKILKAAVDISLRYACIYCYK